MVNLLTLEVKEFLGLIANASESEKIRRIGSMEYEIFEKLRDIESISLNLFLKLGIKQPDIFIDKLSPEKVCNQTCHY